MSDAALTRRLGVPASEGRAVGWWGMVLLIITEAMLFALLLFTWFYLRNQAPVWPPEGIPMPELVRSGIRSGLLLFSSVTMAYAEHALRKDHRGRFLFGAAVTFALAAVFLAGHVHEMLMLPAEYDWTTNAYGSARYTILNFHGLHLAVGMAFLLYAFVAAARGRYDADHDLGVVVTSMYWHFVDVIWVFVYSSLYLLPHLVGK